MNLSDQIERKFIETFAVDDWEVESDTGFVPIISTNKTIEYEVYRIDLENGTFLECADTHILFDQYHNEVFAMDAMGIYIQTKLGLSRVYSVVNTGRVEHMYDLSVDSDDHRYYTNDILSHNTTCVAAYMVWYTLFNSYKTTAVLANKATTAREILGRVQRAYEYLPKWMQHGVVEWNKGSFELENGSRILASSTSSSAIRGFSIDCLTGDTIVRVNIDQKTRDISLADLYLELKTNIIESPRIMSEGGVFRAFAGIRATKRTGLIKLTFASGASLRMTHEHKLLTTTGYRAARCISIGDKVECSTGHTEVTDKELLDDTEFVYDPVHIQDTHNFYANGILSHNCLILDEYAFVPNNIADEFFASVYPTISSGKNSKIAIISTPNGLNHFYKIVKEAESGSNGFNMTRAIWSDIPGRDQKWANEQRVVLGDVKFSQEMECAFIGGTNTLISGDKLSTLPVVRPISSSDTLKIYHEPDKSHSYVMTVDTSRGLGNDYSAFVIVDVTSLPYTVVAVYRDNTVSPMVYPGLILKMATLYNQAAVLVENNDMGESISNALYYELEYEMIIKSHDNVISSFGGRVPGFKTTRKTKSLGCSTLKSLIEGDKLVINDVDTIYELSNFTAKGSSYEADIGHDDLVMCLVMFAYLTIQPAMDDFTSVSARNQILVERMQQAEDDMLPIGSFVDGTESEQDIMAF